MTSGELLRTRLWRDRHDGRLGLGLYLIPGFPDTRTSEAALQVAAACGVSFVEEPAGGDPGAASPRTGPLIRRALSRRTGESFAGWHHLGARAPGRVLIGYADAWPAPEDWRIPPALADHADAILLEPTIHDVRAYAAQARSRDIPLVPALSATAPAITAQDITALEVGGPFVYLALGRETGQSDATPADVARRRDEIRQIRPDLPICCAFGIKTPAEVARLREARLCEAVIIGSAALERLAHGITAFQTWLTDITRAAGCLDEAPCLS